MVIFTVLPFHKLYALKYIGHASVNNQHATKTVLGQLHRLKSVFDLSLSLYLKLYIYIYYIYTLYIIYIYYICLLPSKDIFFVSTRIGLDMTRG